MTRAIRLCWFLSICLVVCGGCRQAADAPAGESGGVVGSEASGSSPSAQTSLLTNRAWTRFDSSDLPGILRVFLTDGTMLLDSCWETYRLAKWRMEADQTLVWNEDGMDIRVKVVVLNEGELVLRLDLVSGVEEQHYKVAQAPYVCPDMPR